MICHTVFALIANDEVKHVIVGEFYDCNEIARLQYGQNAFAVEVTQIPTQAGDLFENGIFYRMVDGVKQIINPIPTAEQQCADLEEKVSELNELLTISQLALVDMMKGDI